MSALKEYQFEVYFNENSGRPYKDLFKITAFDEDAARRAAYDFAESVFKDRPGFDTNRTSVMEVEDIPADEKEFI